MVRLWGDLERVEKRHRLDFLREPDLGFVWAAYRWANGKGLESVLRDADLTAGDFVRWCKQLIDLLGQIAKAADADLRGHRRRRHQRDQARRRRLLLGDLTPYTSCGSTPRKA